MEPDIGALRAYISAAEWRYAKSMPRWPHFYTMLEWDLARADGFGELMRALAEHGYDEWWPEDVEEYAYASPRKVRYFKLDGWRYWAASTTGGEPDMVNRAQV